MIFRAWMWDSWGRFDREIWADSLADAEQKVRRRYPGCCYLICED